MSLKQSRSPAAQAHAALVDIDRANAVTEGSLTNAITIYGDVYCYLLTEGLVDDTGPWQSGGLQLTARGRETLARRPS
jgi:hypothetical protein